MTTIKKGYRITVTSWENDADNYNTKSIEGLDENEIKFHVELAKMHVSENQDRNAFGNIYDPSDLEREKHVEALTALGMRYPGVINNWIVEEGEEVLVEDYSTLIHDSLGELGLRGSEFYTRVTESFVVEYIPEDIHIQDVTAQFI
jgi:hypothetical protein